jgi:hypothetical protein
MVPPDYQEFANLQNARQRDNTVIWGNRTTSATEIGAALRDCHA